MSDEAEKVYRELEKYNMCVVYIEHINKFNIRILSGRSIILFKYKKGFLVLNYPEKVVRI